MDLNILPFNIELLNINNIDKNPLIYPIRSLDSFEGSTKNFHPEGLFSQEIFGKLGSSQRQETFAYIDLKCEILHPVIYKAVLELKRLYGDILTGKAWAIWNSQTKDFEKSDPGVGGTGYTFFLSKLDEIQFEQNESPKRQHNIKLLEKYKKVYRISKIPVLPAGLRDYEVDEDGTPKKNEINTYYVKILALTNLVDANLLKVDPSSLDTTRANIQLRVLELYEYIINLLKGKKKFTLGKWATRKIYNGTRNVITSLISNTDELGSDTAVGFNQSVVGLYEFIKMYLPLSMFNIRQMLNKSLLGPNEQAILINKKTLHKEMVNITSEDYDKWMSDEGLEKTLTLFGTDEVRHDVLEINDHYLLLLYLPTDGLFKVIHDIDDIPEDWKEKYPQAEIRPISFCELLYISMYKRAPYLPAFLTRYPISSLGSIYPTLCYLRTTVTDEQRVEINDDWKTTALDEEGKPIRAKCFPKRGVNFTQSISPHPSRLKRLDADFDGDVCSLNGVYSDEAIAEIKKLFNSKRYYLASGGQITFSMKHDTLEFILLTLTKPDPK